jgi:N-methylhydantoinase A
MNWVVGVDVGGTFTDFCLFNRETSQVVVHKVPSTPEDPARAILDGLAAVKERHGIRSDDISHFAHGTTVATNALIERTGGRIAMITTAGFRDLIEIGRQVRPRIYDLKADAPAPLVRRHLRFEVLERIGPKGEVITPLTDEEIGRVVEMVAASDVDCCAVCLLFSFLNGDHERRIAAALQQRLPKLHVSTSSQVQPEFREYERFSTTVLNSFLQPKVSGYMKSLKAALSAEAGRATIGISQSAGGLMDIDRACEVPIRTALSGPAAGMVGAVAVAAQSFERNLITLDIGGTSTDVCLIEDGVASMTYGRDIAEFPVRLPAIDIHTIGAGGGSIAFVGPDGLLKVGPASAGAVPGPACYRRGGTRPTVSDANVILGRLPESLVGGGMTLDKAAAAGAVQQLAGRLELGLHETALGILRIVTSNIVRAIRVVSIERGYDPRDFSLMSFGGAGGLHAVDVARELAIRKVLVPLSPGILCAEGVARSDMKEGFVATCRTPLNGDLRPVNAVLDRLSAAARAWFETVATEGELQTAASLEMRYVGQNYELAVALEDARVGIADASALQTRFSKEHQARYGHFDEAAPIEIVNVRLICGVGGQSLSGLRYRPAATTEADGVADVWFDASGPTTTKVHARGALASGRIIPGPAIITQFDATTLVPPLCTAVIDDAFNIVIEVSQ